MDHQHNYKPHSTKKGIICACGNYLNLEDCSTKINLIELVTNRVENDINNLFDVVCRQLKRKACGDDFLPINDLYVDGDRRE